MFDPTTTQSFDTPEEPPTPVQTPTTTRTSTRSATRLSPSAWLKKNLFSSIGNSIITVIVGAVLLFVLVEFVRWLISINFDIVRTSLRVFMIGSFPDDQLWRLWIAGYLFMFAIGFAGGCLARTEYAINLEAGEPAQPDSLLRLARRFWAVIAIFIFFASFARTWAPMILAVTAVLMVGVGRYVGWSSPATVRTRMPFIVALSVLAAMIVITGTSTLAGMAVGLVVLVWVLSEFARRDASANARQRLVSFAVALAMAVGAAFVIRLIPFDGYGWKEWGGLMVNMFAAIVGIALGLPLGILLALGRRSELSVVKSASVLFIEFVRGVPLISLLMFSTVLLPLFLPASWETPTALTLAVIVIMFFSAAYIAEIVRGGLQAIPKGQTEAGQALGLRQGYIQRLIVLPQALRAVIPAMVGQFIALFKDTSLLFAANVLEFLGAGTVANNQPEYLGKGLAPVTYLFVALGFWAFAYTMSKESRRLENRLGVGVR